MNLTELIQNLRNTPSQENNKAFAEFFRGLVDTNAQVYTAAKAQGNGYAIDTAEHSGNVYCIMYSDSGKLVTGNGSKGCTIGLSDLINCIYANPHLAGLVINPQDNPIYLQRKDLQFASGKEDPRQKARDWGTGIPEYRESDLMVAEEAMDFAMEIVAAKGLEVQKYELLEVNNGLTTFPNFVVKKDGILYFVSVGVAVAPKMPTIDEEAVPQMLAAAEEYGAKVLYAPVSFCSADPERAAASLALCGDSFIGTFPGFLEIMDGQA